MIQFNLLPDVKVQYMKAARTKRIVITAALGVVGLSVLVVLLLALSVGVFQKQHLSNLDKDIQAYTKQLKETPDINKILTVQNQLSSLPGLHEEKPIATRSFDYISRLTPGEVGITKLKVSFSASTMDISGEAPTLNNVNQFVDTLKFTEYTVEGSEDKAKAFSDVVLSNFTLQDGKTAYIINLKFDPNIFNATKKINLIVPKITTTRSEVEKPAALFQPDTEGTN